MGKIVVKDNSADLTDAKAEAKSEKPKKPKAKSSVASGGELVVAPARTVAVVNKKKTAKAGTGKKKTVKVIEGTFEENESQADEKKTTEAGAKTEKAEKAGGKKKAAKSLSGMVIDSTVKPAGAKVKVDAEADGYAVDEAEANEKVKAKKEGESGQPRFSKPKSVLIGVGVALAVAIIGFVGIWFFSRKPVEKCVVQFEPNGGSQVNAQSVVCGTMVEEPEAPTKDGFDFKGWAFEGLEFNFEKTPVTKDMILVAWWEAHADTEVVRVSFDTAGGSAMNSIEIKKGGTLETIATVPTKYGYTFAGWYLGDEPFDFMQTVDNDLTLTAHWKEKPQNTNNGGNNSGSSSNGGSNSGSGEPTVSMGMCEPTKKSGVGTMQLLVGQSASVSANMVFANTTNCNVKMEAKGDTVRVERGSVTGLAAGTGGVRVCLTHVTGEPVECAEIPVKVEEEPKPEEPEVVPVTGVSIERGSEITVDQETNVRLRAIVAPSGATDPAVSWAVVEGGDVITVTSTNGEIMDVRTVKAGTAKVTVTTRDGGHTATITITVKAKEEEKPDEPQGCEDGKVKDENGMCVVQPPVTGGEGESGTTPES